MEQLDIHLLSDFRILHNGVLLTKISAERLQSLLAYLLLHRQAPQPRHHIAFVLWPDSSEAQARTNLRNLLHSLRQTLPAADRFIATDNLTLQWRLDAPYQLDVAAFEQALAQAKQTGETSARRQWLEQAITHYTGDLLPGNYDDWIIPLRDELRQRYCDALSTLITLLEETGDYRAALQQSQRLLAQDALNETAYVQLMRLHALSGDRAAVRRVYQQCVATLQRELEVDPSPTTTQAYEQLLRLEVQAAAPLTSTRPQHQPIVAASPAPVALPLPAQSTQFIGRDAELAEIERLLMDPDCRLLTLIGPGGIGKTRLALQAAGKLVGNFAQGVAFVGLAAAQQIDQLFPALATALNFMLAGMASPQEQMYDFLRDKSVLLVLDNLEQLLSGSEILSELLIQAPGVKLLITSRERLYLHEEWVVEVHGLMISDDQAETSAAVTLFLQSARRTRSNFTPSAEDLTAIYQICRLVDGMPLGIELAAAWVHLLSCDEIVKEIERSLDFLATPARNVPERHRTLRAVFDHSWQLLAEAEQAVLRRLAVFRSTFDRQAAEAVAGASLALLSALVNKSLLRRAASGRYELHERVRQYAYRKLHEVGEAEAIRDRHLHTYLALADATELKLFGGNQTASLALLESEHDNFRSALEWGLRQTSDAQIRLAALRLTAVLARFWHLREHLYEGRAWLEEALILAQQWPAGEAGAAQSGAIQAVRAKLLYGLGNLTGSMDDKQRSIALLEESLALLRQLDDRRALVLTLQRLGELLSNQKEARQVAARLEESLTLARALQDNWLIARSLVLLAIIAIERGDYAGGEPLARESLAIYRTLDDAGSLVYLLNVLGQFELQLGNPQQAVACFAEALVLDQIHNPMVSLGQAWTLRNLGFAAQTAGDYAQATVNYQQSLRLRLDLNDIDGAAWCLEGLAEVAVATGAPTRAVQLWAVAEKLRSAAGSTMSAKDRARYEQAVAQASQQLGPEVLARLWSAGSAMSLAEVAGFALM